MHIFRVCSRMLCSRYIYDHSFFMRPNYTNVNAHIHKRTLIHRNARTRTLHTWIPWIYHNGLIMMLLTIMKCKFSTKSLKAIYSHIMLIIIMTSINLEIKQVAQRIGGVKDIYFNACTRALIWLLLLQRNLKTMVILAMNQKWENITRCDMVVVLFRVWSIWCLNFQQFPLHSEFLSHTPSRRHDRR